MYYFTPFTYTVHIPLIKGILFKTPKTELFNIISGNDIDIDIGRNTYGFIKDIKGRISTSIDYLNDTLRIYFHKFNPLQISFNAERKDYKLNFLLFIHLQKN
jgi:hypothetical protein